MKFLNVIVINDNIVLGQFRRTSSIDTESLITIRNFA